MASKRMAALAGALLKGEAGSMRCLFSGQQRVPDKAGEGDGRHVSRNSVMSSGLDSWGVVEVSTSCVAQGSLRLDPTSVS